MTSLPHGFCRAAAPPQSELTAIARQRGLLSRRTIRIPFNPSTVISYQLPVNSQVTLKVYDVLGREVAALVNDRQEAGSYSVLFNTNKGTLSLSSGVYFYRLETGSLVSIKKLVLLK